MSYAPYDAEIHRWRDYFAPPPRRWAADRFGRSFALAPAGRAAGGRRASAAPADASALLLTLIMASTVGMVASSIYVANIPGIAADLGTSVAAVELTFVGYLAAFAGSMLVLGPLSDRFGRRPVMFAGLAVATLGSVACALSPNVECLIAARIVQGLGACAGMAVGRASIRDVHGRDGAARVLSILAFTVTLVQAFAPVLGGHVAEWSGWRANFVLVAVLAVLALGLAWAYLPETAGRGAAAPTLGRTFAEYGALLRSRTFLAFALTATGAHAGFHIFAAGAPAVLIGTFGVKPEAYGLYAMLPPFGFLVGSFLSSRLTLRLDMYRLIVLGGATLLAGGATMVLLTLLGVGGPLSIIAPMFVICCGSGLATPSAIAGGIGAGAKAAGVASGLLSFMQIAGAASATMILSHCDSTSPVQLAVLIASVGAFAMAAFGALLGRNRPA